MDVSHVKKDGYIIYTIPAGFSSQTININATEDVKTMLEGSYVPGDEALFTIKIVNNSVYTFNYVKILFMAERKATPTCMKIRIRSISA